MASINKVILIGRLGSTPDIKHLQGACVAKFSLATSERHADRDGNKQETTEWHKIVVWNKLAENCVKYLDKGKQAYVEGKIQTVSWDDTQTGAKRYATEIVAHTVLFLDPPTAGRSQSAPPPQVQAASSRGPVPNLEEIPF